MGSVLESIKGKSGAVLSIIIGSRLCSNKIRKYLLKKVGWKIGDEVIIHWGVQYTPLKMTIGDRTFLARSFWADGEGEIIIGSDTRIGPHCKVLTTTHPIEPAVPRRIEGKNFDLKVIIEDGCWIGTGVTILPGVVISRGCVIAAGSVVAKSTRPNTLCAGVPAIEKKVLPDESALEAPPMQAAIT